MQLCSFSCRTSNLTAVDLKWLLLRLYRSVSCSSLYFIHPAVLLGLPKIDLTPEEAEVVRLMKRMSLQDVPHLQCMTVPRILAEFTVPSSPIGTATTAEALGVEPKALEFYLQNVHGDCVKFFNHVAANKKAGYQVSFKITSTLAPKMVPVATWERTPSSKALNVLAVVPVAQADATKAVALAVQGAFIWLIVVDAFRRRYLARGGPQ